MADKNKKNPWEPAVLFSDEPATAQKKPGKSGKTRKTVTGATTLAETENRKPASKAAAALFAPPDAETVPQTPLVKSAGDIASGNTENISGKPEKITPAAAEKGSKQAAEKSGKPQKREPQDAEKPEKAEKVEKPNKPAAIISDADVETEPAADNAAEKAETKKSEKARRRRRKKRPIVVFLTFIPNAIVKLFKNFSRKHKLNITTKTTILYALVFTMVFLLAGAVILIVYRATALSITGDPAMTAKLTIPLILLICLIMPICIALVVALGRAATQGMLKPIKRITETAKKIDTQTLSIRVETGSSEDELYELAEMINHMLDKLQVAFDSQNRFVSDAAHELRTPIAVIQGYSDMLNRWGAGDAGILEEGLTAISGETRNMKALVEKLLFLARADKKTLMIEPHEMHLDELLEEVLSETELYEKQREIVVGQLEQVTIIADRGMIKQAFRIFMDNAIKYTDEGGRITLSCYNEGERSCAFSVSDNGVGIAEKDIPYIFDRFYKCDKSRVRDGESTGLGLSIAKWIAENHDAEVIADSAPGIGTTITMRFYR